MALLKGSFSLIVFLLPLFWAAGERTHLVVVQPAAPVLISSPRSDDVLQGIVTIQGMTAVEGFRSAEISFSYQSDTTGTWFLIEQAAVPVQNGALASWDTTMITDGIFRLRLLVLLLDGSTLENQVEGLRVRNYTVVETSTPQARPAQQIFPTATKTPFPDFSPAAQTPAPLPTNPAVLSPRNLQRSAAQGAVVVFVAFTLAGGYLGLRALSRH